MIINSVFFFDSSNSFAIFINFVNKDTLGSFIQSVPLLENAAFTLADLLVKSRLGVQLVDEAAIRKVMFGLLEVVEVLKGAKGVKK